MRFKNILHSPTSTNHSLNARSPLRCQDIDRNSAVEPAIPRKVDFAVATFNHSIVCRSP
jgi:hypothetical protein